MNINQIQFEKVVKVAKVKAAGHPEWLRAIDRAAEGILSGELIVTLLVGGALVTSPNGSYLANGDCQCEAAKFSHKECKHRAAARLMELYEQEPETVPAPCITRSVERDVVTRRRIKVTRCNDWVV